MLLRDLVDHQSGKVGLGSSLEKTLHPIDPAEPMNLTVSFDVDPGINSATLHSSEPNCAFRSSSTGKLPGLPVYYQWEEVRIEAAGP